MSDIVIHSSLCCLQDLFPDWAWRHQTLFVNFTLLLLGLSLEAGNQLLWPTTMTKMISYSISNDNRQGRISFVYDRLLTFKSIVIL